MASLLSDLLACLGSDRVLTDAMALAPLLLDNRGRWQGRALCAVFPSTTEEVSEIMRVACRHNALVFAQGGNTGNAAAATPVVNDTDVSRTILLSTTRLRRIEKIDTVNDSVVVQAGVPVAAVRETAALQKRLFALSLASDGTATVGGVLATNAGGVHVLRYGNARDLCLGLEVVLCDGRVLDLMRGLRKDNTGYDLKSLFIGSEGTLGIITKAVLKLHPLPASRKVLWLSLDSLRKIEPLFCAFQKQAGHALSAFEIVHQTPLQRVAQVFPEKVKKIDTHSPWSVLVELSYSDTQDETQSADLLESLLEGLLEQGIITDTVLSQSEIQCEALWAVREAVPEAHKKTGGNVKHDISVPRSRLAEFVEQTNAALAKRFSWIEPSVFGHFGDGNLHYNMGVVPGQDPRLCFAFEKEINAIVYEHVARFNGSVAAEHGVGRMKRDLIEQTKPADELQLMRKLKRIFDPDNRLNPGAVVSP